MQRAFWSFSTHQAATNDINGNGTEVIVSILLLPLVIVEVLTVTVISAAPGLPVCSTSLACMETDC